jgi:homoserine O-acetyltransferase/O-succinyltransferase
MSTVQTFRYRQPFMLQNGITLPEYHLAYTTYGTLNDNGDNAVWIFHALTANSDPLSWWPGLAGEGKLFDPAHHFIVCVNMPGSCYGSIGPLEPMPVTNAPFYHSFPLFTVRDMVHAYQPLREALGIQKIQVGIGGSMGGQQLLEWAIEEPELFQCIVPIATNAWHSAWGKAFNASQRWCIELDPTWKQAAPLAGIDGMQAARSMALLSYRHYKTYDLCQSDDVEDALENFKAASYQRYQGEKLAKRFNAFSYYALSLTMDSHHVGRNRAGAANALKKISAPALVIGLQSDILFPLSEQEYLAEHIPDATLAIIDSMYGHDGFLLEFEAIEKEIRKFIPALNQWQTFPVL